MDQASPTNVLSVGLEYSRSEIRFPYQIDRQFSGAVRVTYPFSLDAQIVNMLPAIGLGYAVFLAQLCLARRIAITFPSSVELVQGIKPLIEMLYDVRCWKDGRDLMPPPEFTLPEEKYEPARFTTDGSKRACLLWSGGKDSTLSSLLLAENNFEFYPVHFTANARTEEDERQAVSQLTDRLGLTPLTVEYDFPQYLEIARRYAVTWDTFPYHNAVPFGRDLALALLTLPVAEEKGATYLCMGHEHDSKSLYFDYQGKTIARNDVESTRGAMFLERYINEFVSPTMKLLPPVGVLPEFRILYDLFTCYPELISDVSFCFWGKPCGRCSKCLRYYLVGRVLGKEDLIDFQVNPLEGNNCPDLHDYIEQWQDESMLYREQMLFCLAKLVERGDIRDGEYLLQRFADEIYAHIKDDVGRMERCLMKVYRDPQVPQDFQVAGCEE
jgi:7-cyano-7-deazaguanine synthase in queuosine biosynthesis